MLWNRRIQPPYIRRRNLHKFRERPILINPDEPRVLGIVGCPQPALMAVPAIPVLSRGDEFPRHDRAHLVAYALDRAAKFVPQRHRRLDSSLRPAVPPINVQVRSANRSCLHSHQHVGRPNRRHGDRIHLQASRGPHFPQCLHRPRHLPHSSPSAQTPMLAHPLRTGLSLPLLHSSSPNTRQPISIAPASILTTLRCAQAHQVWPCALPASLISTVR